MGKQALTQGTAVGHHIRGGRRIQTQIRQHIAAACLGIGVDAHDARGDRLVAAFHAQGSGLTDAYLRAVAGAQGSFQFELAQIHYFNDPRVNADPLTGLRQPLRNLACDRRFENSVLD